MAVSMLPGNIQTQSSKGKKCCGDKPCDNTNAAAAGANPFANLAAKAPNANPLDTSASVAGLPQDGSALAALFGQLGQQLLAMLANAAPPQTSGTSDGPVQAQALSAPETPGNVVPISAAKSASLLNNQQGKYTHEDFLKAAGGDEEIAATMDKIYQHPEGRKAIDKALDKGVTLKKGSLPGAEAGVTKYGGGSAPAITVENASVDVVAHELLHAAYQDDINHQTVYNTAHRIATDLGEPVTTAAGPEAA